MGRPGQKVKRKGLAFVIVLAFILILTLAATAFIALSGTEIRMVRRQCDSTKAFYIAEAGIERARYYLISDSDWFDGDINGIDVTQGGTVTVPQNRDDTKTIDDADQPFYSLPYSSTSLDGGSYSVWLLNISGKTDEIWVKATGTYGDSTRIVVVLLKSPRISSDTVTCAVEVEGDLEIKGNAEINGELKEKVSTTIDIATNAGDVLVSIADTTGFNVGDHVLIDEGTSQEEEGKISSIDEYDSDITLEDGLSFGHASGINVYRILPFEEIFGKSKAEMEALAVADYYYYPPEDTFSNDPASGLTWISPAEGAETQITTVYQPCEGILIVDGDFKMTGGVFNGVIWVIGELRISGNPVINGGLFVESGATVDTTVTGTAQINFSESAIGDTFYTFNLSQSTIESWQEVD